MSLRLRLTFLATLILLLVGGAGVAAVYAILVQGLQRQIDDSLREQARLYTDGTFNRPNGRAQVHAVEPEPIRDRPRPDYPFLLNTGRTVEHWHTRTKTGRIPVLEGRDQPGRRGPAAHLRRRPCAGDVEPGLDRADPGPAHRHRAPR